MHKRFSAVVLAAALAAAGGASAHHSGAMYDTNTKISLQGMITEFQWANPHAWIHLEAVDGTRKKATEWVFESLGTNQLTRAGWRKESLKPGEVAVVVFNPLKDGAPGGRVVSVSVDGRQIGSRE